MTSDRGETSPDEKHMVPQGAVLQNQMKYSRPVRNKRKCLCPKQIEKMSDFF